MNARRRDQATTIGLSAARVAASAIHQAARHELALKACLAELEGSEAPADDLLASVRGRAQRHAGRATGLVQTAIRLNPDPASEVFYAALLERHERNAMRVAALAVSVPS